VNRAGRLLPVGLLLVMAVTLLWPIWRVIGGGFIVDGSFTLRYLFDVFRNPLYAEGLFNSLRIAVGTTLLAACIAVPLAWVSSRVSFPGQGVITGLLLVPMILPPFVGAIGLQQMLGQYGVINSLFGLGPVDWLGRGRFAGVVLLQALSLYPILYLNTVAALANVDPAMEEAAENVGCTGFRKFRRITLPLIAPGLFAGGILVFIWSFTELGTPLIMNMTRCAPVQVYDALKDIGSNPFPYALVFVMLSCSAALYGAGRFFFGRTAYAMQSKAAVARTLMEFRGWRAVLVASPFVLVSAFALLPHVGVILTSLSAHGAWYRSVLPTAFTLGNYREALGHDMTVGSIRNSLIYASLAVGLNLVAGIVTAQAVVRSRSRFAALLDAMAMLPLAVPGLVMAFGYLSISSMLSNLPWVKESAFWTTLLDVKTNPTLFLVIAYAVRRLPYMVRSAVAGLQQTPVVLEEAGANLGASPATVTRRIVAPLIAANLVAGALLAFAFSMLEVSDSLMLAQRSDFYPITKTIYELFELIGTGRYVASALGVWAMAFLAATLVGSSLLLGKKLGAIFRA
jgi:iron(III) transport system permease protein